MAITSKTATAAKTAEYDSEEMVQVLNDNIVITLPITKKPTPSASGKTLTLATTGGFSWDVIDIPGYSTVGVSVTVSAKK